MDQPPIPIVHRQLEATLQLLLSLSPIMTNNDLILIRIRLTEANILLGRILSQRSNSAGDGNSISTFLPLFT